MKFYHYDCYGSTKDVRLDPDFQTAKKILVVAGDSWTNHLMVYKQIEHSWVIDYTKLRNYDFVILAANKGDSPTQSFLNIINLFTGMNLRTDNHGLNVSSWLGSNLFQDKKIDVIIQWTSIIRDFSEFSAWYKPHTFASTPDLTDDPAKKEMYEEYVTNILNEKYYSYKVQVYSWQLQKYFERWNIPYYFWMGFCDLVPESVENTDMDIRKYLNKDRWFNLYDKPHNMSDYLFYLEKNIIPKRLIGVMTEGGPTAFLRTASETISKLFTLNRVDTSLSDSFFLHDLHPSEKGDTMIAKILHERF